MCIVDSVQQKQQINVKVGSVVPMRECMVYFKSTADKLFLLPISLWGEALSSLDLEKDTAIVLLNAKRDSYQSMPRMAIGESGVVTTDVQTPQAKALKAFVEKNRAQSSTLEKLPAGLKAYDGDDE